MRVRCHFKPFAACFFLLTAALVLPRTGAQTIAQPQTSPAMPAATPVPTTQTGNVPPVRSVRYARARDDCFAAFL